MDPSMAEGSGEEADGGGEESDDERRSDGSGAGGGAGRGSVGRVGAAGEKSDGDGADREGSGSEGSHVSAARSEARVLGIWWKRVVYSGRGDRQLAVGPTTTVKGETSLYPVKDHLMTYLQAALHYQG
ncbi:glycine-rich protein DOT1-like [Zingiber officinale]|uniref:glycine-rich protein DOT1-like n=1 Tax=Zingiber officinale TaxID=94328 RepID=UPI001C4C0B2D|nr:glycine-rich protein DOT1-like [Zingiber officinale]